MKPLDLLELIGYMAGWIAATRLIYVGMVRSSDDGEHPGLLMPAFLGLFWPLMLGVCVVAAPFVLVGWLATLGLARGAE